MDKVNSIKNEMNSKELLRLKADLLVWYNFNQKCKEIEKKLLPELKHENSSLKSMLDNGVKFNPRKNIAYKTGIENKAKERISANKKELYKELYDEYRESVIEENKEIYRKVKDGTSLIFDIEEKLKVAIIAFGGLGLIMFIITFLLSTEFRTVPLIISIVLVVLAALGGIAYFILEKKYDTLIFNPEYQNIEKKLDYNKWLETNNDHAIEIESKVNVYFEKLEEVAKENIAVIDELREVRNEIAKQIPLPEKYRGDDEVTSLLALVMDGRATSLKEAINLYEEIKFRKELISGINTLNERLGTLTNVMVQGFSAVISSQIQINDRLAAINMNTQVISLDAIWDD